MYVDMLILTSPKSDNILSHISGGKSEMKEEEIRQILE